METINYATPNGVKTPTNRKRASLIFAALCFLAFAGAAAYFFGYRNYVARRHWQAAEAALADYDFKTARTELEKCLQIRRNDGLAHYRMAQTCRRLADLGTAEEHLELARRFGQPDDAIELEHLLVVAQYEGLPPHVINGLQRYFEERCPEEVLILEALVTGFHRKNQILPTSHWLDYWVNHYPDDWRARHWRGSFYLEVGHANEAEEDLIRCLQLKPDCADAHHVLGLAMLKTGTDVAQAKEHFDAYLREHPEDKAAKVDLARCHRRLNQPGEARAILEPLLNQDPDNASAALLLGLIASDEDKLEEAMAYLRRADGHSFNDQEDVNTLVSNMARVSQRLGKTDDAKAYQDRLKGFNEDLRKLNELMEKAMSGKAPPDMQLDAGLLYLRIGLREEGKRWLEAYLQQQPNDMRAISALAGYYAQRKDPEAQDKAKELRQKLGAANNP